MEQSMNTTWKRSGIRDTIVVMGVLLGLLTLQFVVPFQPAQILGYYLLIGFFPVEAVVEGADSGILFYALFGVYVLALSLIGSVAATVFRHRTRDSELTDWRFGVAGGLAVTGAIALLFSVRTLLSGTEPTPVFVGLVTALVLFGLTAISADL
ncbi:hypothetical protein [Halobacterium noricense]|uniref:hypothetical protein n=1 Tax=Halobacterium noricense TaxID=223182 RepID=UPI001E506533|nr:hypothetical protein [Halobacterium noricense]UHH24251.1 hypothetical protein LT974_09635 [Halobacterium noricense]